jgi:CDP-paratose 2-epimerase
VTGSVAVVTGSAGLVGSETARHFAALGMQVVGVDNDLRAYFFGADASTLPVRARLERELGGAYRHASLDIRDRDGVLDVVRGYGRSIALVVHCASQPSHDWAAREPFTDFDVNAVGTLNLLEATRLFAPQAVFVFCSTNKVYGDRPNSLPLVEHATRLEIDPSHPYADGIGEDMPIDACLHSLFGVSKVAADVLVQEYGRYFGLATACFRGGTLTGPDHAAAELHGFLAYLMRCLMSGRHYTVYGYAGKQVRDVIHSADLVAAFERVLGAPRLAAVYNIGGGRVSNTSVLEAITTAERIAGRGLSWSYDDTARIGDHRWWVSSNAAFEADYPGWRVTRDVPMMLAEMHERNARAWS